MRITAQAQTNTIHEGDTAIDRIARKVLNGYGRDDLAEQFVREATSAREVLTDPIAIDSGMTYIHGYDDCCIMKQILGNESFANEAYKEFCLRLDALSKQEQAVANIPESTLIDTTDAKLALRDIGFRSV